ncbi:ATP-binding protein [Streptomyces sp. NPDC048717]|uniref:ATP-binding protein n=1 Tax=unclassified Streptomyces TaxID=2593676 RepID=UPI0033C1629C
MIDTEGDCAEWHFPAEANAVRTARHAVRDTLRTWRLEGAFGDVTVLLVSELVTNSLRYASGPIGVRLVRRHPDGNGSGGRSGEVPTLRVEVSDPLPEWPTTRLAGPDDEGGRGLQLVARSARRWGTRVGGSGKTVWFELALPGE